MTRSRRRRVAGNAANLLLLMGAAWIGWRFLRPRVLAALPSPGTFNPASQNNVVWRNLPPQFQTGASDLVGSVARFFGGPDDTYNPNP